MKKSIILIAFLIITGISTSQTLNIVDTAKLWNVVNCYNYASTSGSGCWMESFKFMGDTTFGGVQYKKLIVSTDSLFSWTYHSAYREDISQGKVYRYTNSGEILFYNFSLITGNTFDFQIHGLNTSTKVSQIGSTTTLDGVQRQSIIFDLYVTPDSRNYNEEWYQGIGSSFGLPYVSHPQWDDPEIDHELICVWDNGIEIWHNLNYQSCWVISPGTTQINKNQEKIELSVFPNPTSDIITINFDINENLEYAIYSTLGELVLTGTINSYNKVIDLSILTPNIYFLKANNQTLKLIKSSSQ